MRTSKTPSGPLRRSPLYTSRTAELAKRQRLEEVGSRDLDGAFRSTNRRDKAVSEVAP